MGLSTIAYLKQYRNSHFAPAFLFLSPERRMALKSLYAVCRVLDDAVDKPHPNPQGFLDAWGLVFSEQNLEQVDRFGQKALAQDFLNWVHRFEIPLFAMSDLIEKGVSLDLKSARFQTAMDVESYFYGVAGTVGLACLPIFGVPWTEGRDFAVRLGITVQSINCIRDVGDDVQMNRIYIPLDHLREFKVSEPALLAKEDSPAFRELMCYKAKEARSHYARACELMPPRWRRELLPARIMGNIYMKLLQKIERKGFPVLHSKTKLNTFEKCVATWQTVYEKHE